MATSLRVAMVPEHFNIPLIKAKETGEFEKENLDVSKYGRGTGSMCKDMRSEKLDVIFALTEGIINDIITNGPNFHIVSPYVTSSLTWAVVCSPSKNFSTLSDLKDCNFGISRQGSGSHIMSYLLASKQNWKIQKKNSESNEGIKFTVIGGVDDLINAITEGKIDCFLWETYMLKPRVEAGHLKYVGTVVTPWPCFMIAVKDEIIKNKKEEVKQLLRVVQDSTKSFKENTEASIQQIVSKTNLSEEDAKQWFEQVEFADSHVISNEVIQNCVEILKQVEVFSQDVEVQYDTIVNILD